MAIDNASYSVYACRRAGSRVLFSQEEKEAKREKKRVCQPHFASPLAITHYVLLLELELGVLVYVPHMQQSH